MHSVSDLTTFARRTTGDVPPRIVGASTTVVRSKLYLFGGRLPTERRMVSELYELDLETFVWKKLEISNPQDAPAPRYFHSTDAWNDHLVVFGGMGYLDEASEELCVLADLRMFDLNTRSWIPAEDNTAFPNDRTDFIPRARYAHLSAVTANRFFLVGGQDLSNLWLDDIHVFDLETRQWVQRHEYPKHCGTYRSAAVSAPQRVRTAYPGIGPGANTSSLGLRFRPDNANNPSTDLLCLPYTESATAEDTDQIFLYSNYNFTDVKRELEVFSGLDFPDFSVADRSASMSGSSLPPGLRFPTGVICGTHLLIAGTYLAHSFQAFSIWALNLETMEWSRIDPGAVLATGSWSRACLWTEKNQFLIFGNRDGNLVNDYNRRLLSWDDVACIDLEAFGIYQPPRLQMNIRAQATGIAALEQEAFADFDIVCHDGRRLRCNRRILEERWPWFREQRVLYLAKARKALEDLPTTAADVELPQQADRPETDDMTPDPRLTPRALHLSEPYPICLAFLQYLYSLNLITPLQHAPAVLSGLLVLSTTYNLSQLQALVKHAMHRGLNSSTSVGVYEVATLCDCQSLQIRALKVVMASSRRGLERPSASRLDGSGRNPDGSSGRSTDSSSRPRGMSDAHNGHSASDHASSSRTNGVEPVNGHYGRQLSSQGPIIEHSELPLRRSSIRRSNTKLGLVTILERDSGTGATPSAASHPTVASERREDLAESSNMASLPPDPASTRKVLAQRDIHRRWRSISDLSTADSRSINYSTDDQSSKTLSRQNSGSSPSSPGLSHTTDTTPSSAETSFVLTPVDTSPPRSLPTKSGPRLDYSQAAPDHTPLITVHSSPHNMNPLRYRHPRVPSRVYGMPPALQS
ncbi:galactose oxidase [Sistotremastrum suecicum HHB10207 ss-3]|uniref:Galactose oxidase n=1 Tax=Sistotremastrum suecicum HHB10207 ss-3 TaxID=1314776 RepID=A0A166II47_9AGAM|nr:galactose oxidase [Sistotremastrum suecicum HHB10207 ss-3]